MSTVPVLTDDPFSDDQFAALDMRSGAEVRGMEPPTTNPTLLHDLAQIANENPELMEAEPNAPPRMNRGAAPLPPALEEQPEVVATPETTEPEEYELPDGSTIVIEKTSKGWKATGQTAKGKNPEVFYGKSQKDLLVNVMAGKLNATTKIRQLNREAKMNRMEVPAPALPAVNTPAPVIRQLTADETIQLKTQLASDPALAFDNMFQKRTGLTFEQLGKLLKEGQEASMELDSEKISRAFVAATPEYYADEENHNYFAILRYLAKFKLGERFNPENYSATQDSLIRNGFWTVKNLQQAFETLNEDDLLVTDSDVEEDEPETETPITPVVRQTQTPSNPRIADVRRRSRAAQGIRQAEISNTSVVEDNGALPVEEQLDNMSTDDIAKLMAGVRRDRAQRARR